MRRTGLSLCPAVVLVLSSQTAPAQQPGHAFHPPMPDQTLYLQCLLNLGDEPTLIEVPLQLPSPTMSADLDQVVEMPASLPPVRLLKYLPRARLNQEVLPVKGPEAQLAVQIAVEGPSQAYKRWLVAGDPIRNRLISLIATWRFMAVENRQQRDDLYEQFRHEFTRPPRLLITNTKTGQSGELAAETGQVAALADLGCQVRVQEFFPDFALDSKSKKPINQSEKRLNPAALVEIEYQGRREKRWAFAKFPDYKTGKTELLPFRIALDCPTDKQSKTPDFMLLSVDRAALELWVRHQGRTSVKPLEGPQRVEIAGSQYAFYVARFVPSGRLVEEYLPTQGKGGVSALQVRTSDAAGKPTTIWLELGKQRVVPTTKGPLTVAFGPRRPTSTGGHQ